MTPFPAHPVDPARSEKCVPESVFLLKGSSKSDLGRRSRGVRAAVNELPAGVPRSCFTRFHKMRRALFMLAAVNPENGLQVKV